MQKSLKLREKAEHCNHSVVAERSTTSIYNYQKGFLELINYLWYGFNPQQLLRISINWLLVRSLETELSIHRLSSK